METEKARRRKSFLLSEKKSNAKEQFYNSISDALLDLQTSNAIDLTIDLTMLVYGNRQNTINFARADNFVFFVSTETFIVNQVLKKEQTHYDGCFI